MGTLGQTEVIGSELFLRQLLESALFVIPLLVFLLDLIKTEQMCCQLAAVIVTIYKIQLISYD
jgi:hypothetical protein